MDGMVSTALGPGGHRAMVPATGPPSARPTPAAGAATPSPPPAGLSGSGCEEVEGGVARGRRGASTARETRSARRHDVPLILLTDSANTVLHESANVFEICRSRTRLVKTMSLPCRPCGADTTARSTTD